MFWNIVTLTALGVGNYLGPTNLGLPINIYSSEPDVRMEQMLIDSENLREMHDQWRLFWQNGKPTHVTPYRIHGGVGPASSDI